MESTGDGFPSQIACNVESAPTPWRHHAWLVERRGLGVDINLMPNILLGMGNKIGNVSNKKSPSDANLVSLWGRAYSTSLPANGLSPDGATPNAGFIQVNVSWIHVVYTV